MYTIPWNLTRQMTCGDTVLKGPASGSFQEGVAESLDLERIPFVGFYKAQEGPSANQPQVLESLGRLTIMEREEASLLAPLPCMLTSLGAL